MWLYGIYVFLTTAIHLGDIRRAFLKLDLIYSDEKQYFLALSNGYLSHLHQTLSVFSFN